MMNIYNTRQIRCTKCDKFLGEIEYDAQVIMPTCNRCNNSMPEGFLAYNKIRKNL